MNWRGYSRNIPISTSVKIFTDSIDTVMTKYTIFDLSLVFSTIKSRPLIKSGIIAQEKYILNSGLAWTLHWNTRNRAAEAASHTAHSLINLSRRPTIIPTKTAETI